MKWAVLTVLIMTSSLPSFASLQGHWVTAVSHVSHCIGQVGESGMIMVAPDANYKAYLICSVPRESRDGKVQRKCLTKPAAANKQTVYTILHSVCVYNIL